MRKTDMICVIGGGSGMPVINKALVRAGYKNISSIVTTFDSGGDSGRLRTDERGKVLAFSDYWRSLISLWKDGQQKEIWEDMLKFRDGRGRNFGNLFFQFMSEKAGNLTHVDELFSALTGAKLYGKVIPVSLDPSNLCFVTKSGKSYCGEHHLDFLRMSNDTVVKIWLEPEVEANPEAVLSILKSHLIIISPGSMYGSIITNFLPRGIVEAYNRSKAKKILMTNIMSVANENNKFSQHDYVKVFGKYLESSKPFDLVVMADLTKLNKTLLKKTLKLYEMEHSFPIKYIKDLGINTKVMDIAVIESNTFTLRHSETKLAEKIDEIIGQTY